MSSIYNIKRATMEDLPAIADIYDKIHIREKHGLANTGWVKDVYPTEQTAKAGIEQNDMFLLEIDGNVAAAARINKEQAQEYLSCQWKMDAPPEKVMVLHTLVVHPSYARKGVGKSFVAFYEQYARQRDCPYLRLDTVVTNLEARAFYKKLGYTEGREVKSALGDVLGVKLILLEKYLGK